MLSRAVDDRQPSGELLEAAAAVFGRRSRSALTLDGGGP
jgi:hypothetical protein